MPCARIRRSRPSFTEAPDPQLYQVGAKLRALRAFLPPLGSSTRSGENEIFKFHRQLTRRRPPEMGRRNSSAAFNASYDKVGDEVGFYSRSLSYRVKKYSFPKTLEPSIDVTGSPRTGKSQTSRRRRWPVPAIRAPPEAVLVRAYDRAKAAERLDLRLTDALGIWEAAHGHREKAAPWSTRPRQKNIPTRDYT